MPALESADSAGVVRQLLTEGQPAVLRTMMAVFAARSRATSGSAFGVLPRRPAAWSWRG
jgi:hypothetical protein